MAKKKSWNGYGGYNWASYNSYFSKFESRFKATEDRREFKNGVREEAAETYTPITARVNKEETKFIKRRKMVANVKDDDLHLYNDKEKIKKLVEAYDKMPFNSDIIDSEMLKEHLTSSSILEKFQKNRGTDVNRLTKEYFDGKITYKEFRDNFRMPTKSECDLFAPSKGGYEGFGRVGTRHNMNKTKYNQNLKLIKSKIKLTDIVNKEENLRKGKRINRGFLNNTSYKPLMSKDIIAPKKKKLFVIVDCSGSMGRGSCETDPAYTGMSFVGACVNSGVFDVDHVILHSSGGWENVAPKIKKGELFSYTGGGEGFEVIDDNLEHSRLEGVDYILVITDLCIGSSAERGIYEYIKGKKHIIMSYRNSGTLKGMNVRCIKDNKDMVNALSTLVS